MSRGRGQKRTRRLPGLVPEAFPKPVRWRVEIDYEDRLSDKDKAWLARFNNEFHGGDFSKPGPRLHRTKEQRRAIWRDSKTAGADAYEIARVSGLVQDAPPGHEPTGGPQDLSPTPEYLNSAEYKARVAEFRARIPEDNRRRPEDPTPEEKATWSLDAAEAQRKKNGKGKQR